MNKNLYETYIQCPKCLKNLIMKTDGIFNKTPYCKECDIYYYIHIKHMDNEEIKISIKEK